MVSNFTSHVLSHWLCYIITDSGLIQNVKNKYAFFILNKLFLAGFEILSLLLTCSMPMTSILSKIGIIWIVKFQTPLSQKWKFLKCT